jgi:1,4-alpha-glucan branching enzyme
MKKTYAKSGRVCRVTFEMQPADNPQSVVLCGEFNDWDPLAHPMKRRKDGYFALTLSLTVGHAYRFRYLLNGGCWENDPQADAQVPNPFGSQDSVIQI